MKKVFKIPMLLGRAGWKEYLSLLLEFSLEALLGHLYRPIKAMTQEISDPRRLMHDP